MATGLFYFVTSLQVPARQGYLLEGFVKPPASLSTFLTLFHHQMDLPSSSVCRITLLHQWESFLHRVPAFLDPFIQNTLDQARRNIILLKFWDAGEEGGWVGGWREAHCLTFSWHFWNSEIWSNWTSEETFPVLEMATCCLPPRLRLETATCCLPPRPLLPWLDCSVDTVRTLF